MARYTGAICRKSRRYNGVDLDAKTRPLESKCKLNNTPGQHAQARKKGSDYGQQLIAKQQLKFKYGMLERQFRRFYREAARRRGPTGVILLQLLECRLDSMVYRMGFAATRREARQLVSHGAVMVNGRRINIPSYEVKTTDVISICEKSRAQARILEAIQNVDTRGIPDWIEVDHKKMEGVLKRVPDRLDLPSDINEQLVVELYSK